MTPADIAGLAQSDRSEVRALVAELRNARAELSAALWFTRAANERADTMRERCAQAVQDVGCAYAAAVIRAMPCQTSTNGPVHSDG